MAGTLVVVRGGQYNTQQTTPAGAMARGLAVTISTTTIAKCGDGARPDGFLMTEVTTDGLSWLELENIPHAEVEENKVSVGKVRFVLFEDGVEIATDNDGGETWAVGDTIYCAASGVLTKTGASGDYIIGVVRSITYACGGQAATANLINLIELQPGQGKKA